MGDAEYASPVVVAGRRLCRKGSHPFVMDLKMIKTSGKRDDPVPGTPDSASSMKFISQESKALAAALRDRRRVDFSMAVGLVV